MAKPFPTTGGWTSDTVGGSNRIPKRGRTGVGADARRPRARPAGSRARSYPASRGAAQRQAVQAANEAGNAACTTLTRRDPVARSTSFPFRRARLAPAPGGVPIHTGPARPGCRGRGTSVRSVRGRVPRPVRQPPPVDRGRQRPAPGRWPARRLQRAGHRGGSRDVARHEDTPGRHRARRAHTRRAGRSPDCVGPARRLAAGARHQPELAEEPDALRVGDLRRRAQPDDDGVGAARGAGRANHLQAEGCAGAAGGREDQRREPAARDGRARRAHAEGRGLDADRRPGARVCRPEGCRSED